MGDQIPIDFLRGYIIGATGEGWSHEVYNQTYDELHSWYYRIVNSRKKKSIRRRFEKWRQQRRYRNMRNFEVLK